MNNYADLVFRAKSLLRSVYAALRADEIQRDYPFSTAIQKAVINIVSCLANASASRERAYLQRGLGFARSSTSELKGLVEAATTVGYLIEHHEKLQDQIQQMDIALANVQGTLDARFDR